MSAAFSFTFSTNLAEPPTGSQVRFDAAHPYTAVAKVWIRNETSDGVDVHVALMQVAIGSTIYVQDKNDHTQYAVFVTTAAPIDKGDYVEIPVSWSSNGLALVSQAIEVVVTLPSPVPEPPNVSSGSTQWTIGRSVAYHAISVLREPPTVEPLTLEQAKLRAGFNWLPGDERDALLQDFIRAARQRVEMDTGLALPTQTREVYLDMISTEPILLPGQCSPVQSVERVFARLADGTTVDIPETQFLLDKVSHPARITFFSGAVPSGAPLAMQPWGLELVTGWPTPAAIPPLLVHAVGLLAGHYLTSGRDVIAIGTIASDLPFGYEHVISGYRPALVY